MIDLHDGNWLTFAQAAQSLPGRPHVSTIARWAARSIGGVKLATVKIGGRRFVNRRALEEFSAATTAAADKQPAPACSTGRREREIQAVERELDRAGIGIQSVFTTTLDKEGH